jgi:hypothetical protein
MSRPSAHFMYIYVCVYEDVHFARATTSNWFYTRRQAGMRVSIVDRCRHGSCLCILSVDLRMLLQARSTVTFVPSPFRST